VLAINRVGHLADIKTYDTQLSFVFDGSTCHCEDELCGKLYIAKLNSIFNCFRHALLLDRAGCMLGFVPRF